jgi:hypothetical protein
MKKLLSLVFGSLSLYAMSSFASSTAIPQGQIAIMRTGDGTLAHGVGNGVGQDFTYVDVYDSATTNQSSTLYTVTLATNVLWINGHAGSEGQGISRSADRSTMILAGYTGDMNYSNGTPSSAFVTNGGVVSAAFTRGFGLLDPVSGNFNLTHSGYDWFGLPTGVTQNNPTGIATIDGSIVYGSGNVAGSNSAASGVQYYYTNCSFNDGNQTGCTVYNVSPFPNGAGEARIIGGQLYIIASASKGGGTTTNGVYTYVDQANTNAPVPFPWDPLVPSPVEHLVTTNLFINFDAISTQNKIIPLTFDMNTNKTILYAGDQTYGIFKFVNNGGNWSQAYYYSPTNLGTLIGNSSGNQGVFSICVDFSSANPVIYATTMERGTVSGHNNGQGNPNENRLLRIVDTGSSPGTNIVAQTLATAGNTNITFRGVDFTPDLRPYFLSSPADVTTTNGGSATFNAPATAPSSLTVTYQWYQNGSTLLSGQVSSTLMLTSLTTGMSGNTYQCVASDDYGSVTSAVATLTVNHVAQPPVITNSVANVSANVNDNVTFAAINPTGDTPFAFQWYFNGAPLSDGVKYTNSQTSALTIFGLTTNDSGNYYLVANNGTPPAASNLVDALTVSYAAPVIGSQPTPINTFVGTSASLSVVLTAGTTPFTYQWYEGSTPLTDPGATGDLSGSTTNVLTISPASTNDSGIYHVVVTNPNGQSVTSSNAEVTISVPPPPSYVAYSNQVYVQNFDSLPYETNRSINAFNNSESPDSINGVAYSLSNPFDFAFPVTTDGSYLGGLGLSNTLAGWYGASSVPAPTYYAQIGAGIGDQTTGGDLFFGNLGATSTNRALGLQTTGSVGATAFGLKLINTGSNTLNYINLSFVGEHWRKSTGTRTMSVGYTNDPTANSFTLVGGDSISNSTLIPALAFSFPTAVNASARTPLDGTQATNQQNLAVNNYAITPWAPGSALWLIWGMDFYGVGQGNGYAIDNLRFQATVKPIGPAPILQNVNLTAGVGLSFTFTNIPSAGFTVYSATNLLSPTWVPIGAPSETPNGPYSSYSFTDHSATSAAVPHFYKVSSP